VGGRAERAEFLLHDPGGQDLTGRVVLDAAVPHPRQRRLGEPFPAAQQQPPVRPGRVGLTAAAIEQVTGDALAHRGHRLVRQHDQVEVVDRDLRVRQDGADRGGVAGVRVDHHHLDPGPEGLGAGGEPGLHRGAGPAVHLPQQGLVAGDVDEPGLPRIGARPAAPAILTRSVMHAVGQPPRAAEPGLVHAQHPHRFRLEQLHQRMDTTARCTIGHDTPCAAATSDWSRPSSTATASAVLSRVVVRIPAGTWATCSVNLCCGQSSVWHRQRRLRHCTYANSPPHGRSRGRVSTQSLPDVDTARHTGQRAASGSSVTNCTIFTPSTVSTTRSTVNPAKPNKHDASSLRSTTARGSPLAAPRHSEDQGAAGRLRSGAPDELTPRLPGQDRRAVNPGRWRWSGRVRSGPSPGGDGSPGRRACPRSGRCPGRRTRRRRPARRRTPAPARWRWPAGFDAALP
jgi:hypothetical protein